MVPRAAVHNFGDEKIFFSLPGIEPCPFGRATVPAEFWDFAIMHNIHNKYAQYP